MPEIPDLTFEPFLDSGPTPPVLGEAWFRQILDTIADGVYVVDNERRILYWNRGAETLSGFPAIEVLGSFCYDGILCHVDDTSRCLCNDGCPLAATLRDGKPRKANVYMHHKEGQRVPVRVQATPLFDSEGNIWGAVEVFNDNSSMEAAQKTIRTLTSLAMLDPLTGLPNRRCLQLKLSSMMPETAPSSGVAALVADIDHFKQINDRYGHEVGDKVVKMVAKTLAGTLLPPCIVGRWGGDEFFCLFPAIQMTELDYLAHKARSLVEQCYLTTPRGILRTTISIGACVAGECDSPQTLMARADEALYRSKSAGRNRVTLAPPDIA